MTKKNTSYLNVSFTSHNFSTGEFLDKSIVLFIDFLIYI